MPITTMVSILPSAGFRFHGVDAAGEVVETKVKVIECVLVEAGNVSSRLPGIVFE